MTELFLITFSVLIIMMLAMAVGAILKGKPLQGSCGGLGRAIGEDCMFCDKKSECDSDRDDQECSPRIEIKSGRAFLSQ